MSMSFHTLTAYAKLFLLTFKYLVVGVDESQNTPHSAIVKLHLTNTHAGGFKRKKI